MARRCLGLCCFDWREFDCPPSTAMNVFILRGGAIGFGKYDRGRFTVWLEGGLATIGARPTKWAPVTEGLEVLYTDLSPYPPHEPC